MARQLLEVQARTRLSLGKSIAQFLSHQDEADYTILKWLTVYKGGDEKSYAVTYHEVLDEGGENEYDIGEFTAVDAENLPFGVTSEFDTAEEALAFAAATYGASEHKYVAESMINEEYASYLSERNKTHS